MFSDNYPSGVEVQYSTEIGLHLTRITNGFIPTKTGFTHDYRYVNIMPNKNDICCLLL